jgi:hypothetical protein
MPSKACGCETKPTFESIAPKDRTTSRQAANQTRQEGRTMRVNDISHASSHTNDASHHGIAFALAGDHLTDVATRHGIDPTDMAEANPQLNGRSALLTGEAIQVPGASASPRVERVYAEHKGVIADPEHLVGQPVVKNKKGDAQCAELIKHLAHAPNTQPQNWQKGTSITAENVTSMEPGTPIASGWDKQGYYPNNSTGQHTGIFAGPIYDKSGHAVGFKIVEQYKSLDKIKSRDVYFDPVSMKKPDTYFYTAGQYATVKW